MSLLSISTVMEHSPRHGRPAALEISPPTRRCYEISSATRFCDDWRKIAKLATTNQHLTSERKAPPHHPPDTTTMDNTTPPPSKRTQDEQVTRAQSHTKERVSSRRIDLAGCTEGVDHGRLQRVKRATTKGAARRSSTGSGSGFSGRWWFIRRKLTLPIVG